MKTLIYAAPAVKGLRVNHACRMIFIQNMPCGEYLRRGRDNRTMGEMTRCTHMYTDAGSCRQVIPCGFIGDVGITKLVQWV